MPFSYYFYKKVVDIVANKTQQAIIDRIGELCKRRNISYSQLATRCGLPRASIRDIMNGRVKKSYVITIKMICDGLGITLREFFDTEEFESLEQEIE